MIGGWRLGNSADGVQADDFRVLHAQASLALISDEPQQRAVRAAGRHRVDRNLRRHRAGTAALDGELRCVSGPTADVGADRCCDLRFMTDTPQPVLVGIDGSPSGLEALALGGAFAVLTGSPLVLGAVYGFSGGSFAGGLIWPPADDAQHWLDEAATRLGDAIPSGTRIIQSTSPAHGLVQLAELENARMIVLGSNRDGPIGRVLAGATAKRVTHGAPCAVAVAPHDWRPQPPEVPLTFGVGLTDSAESREALALAAAFAASAHAPLKVYTAVHIPPPARPMLATSGTNHAGWRRARVQDAKQMARDAIAALAPQPETEVVVIEGDPVERLADVSRGLDVLVVGSRRFGPVRSALLGGVSARLIERAACPVVIVPRGIHTDAATAVTAEESAHA
jgi:nucleotide-binding universal stress UspA family protein